MTMAFTLAKRTFKKPLIKVCGLKRESDARLCASSGADLMGFIFHPQSPRWIEPEKALRLESRNAVRVGVFVEQKGEEIARVMEEARLDLAQFHGEQSVEDARLIGPERVARVVWPERFASEEEMDSFRKAWEPYATLFLLDSGQKGGGHGKALSSSLARAFSLKSERAVLLAGGLKPSSLPLLWPLSDVAEAGASAKKGAGLVGFDFNSGVEKAPGEKDEALLRELFAAAGLLKAKGPGG
jgi:phosphoribosylanthranilate isomerase